MNSQAVSFDVSPSHNAPSAYVELMTQRKGTRATAFNNGFRCWTLRGLSVEGT